MLIIHDNSSKNDSPQAPSTWLNPWRLTGRPSMSPVTRVSRNGWRILGLLLVLVLYLVANLITSDNMLSFGFRLEHRGAAPQFFATQERKTLGSQSVLAWPFRIKFQFRDYDEQAIKNLKVKLVYLNPREEMDEYTSNIDGWTESHWEDTGKDGRSYTFYDVNRKTDLAWQGTMHKDQQSPTIKLTTGPIKGQVTLNGKGIEGVTIRIYKLGYFEEQITDINGNYEFDTVSGEVHVNAMKPGFTIVGDPGPITEDPLGWPYHNVNFIVTKGPLGGRIKNPSGLGISKIQVKIIEDVALSPVLLTTDINGCYASQFAARWTYKVTPQPAGDIIFLASMTFRVG